METIHFRASLLQWQQLQYPRNNNSNNNKNSYGAPTCGESETERCILHRGADVTRLSDAFQRAWDALGC